MKFGTQTVVAALALASLSEGFQPLSAPRLGRRTQLSATVRDTSSIMQQMRQELAQNEDANLMMQALRGQNINDDDAAVAGLEMRLVDIAPRDNEALPLEYNPEALREFFKSRPKDVFTRIVQVLSVGGGFFMAVLFDQLLGRVKDNPDLEVKRAGELRDLITSLGPFFIKIGQALSIRPDVLSPRSMVELQKLCDKVPSYDSKIAFATIEKELGRPVEEIFSEITPEPVAAASLGR